MKGRYFLIVLLLFFAQVGYAQVSIPDSVATWYLEKNQERIVLEKSVNSLEHEVYLLQAAVEKGKQIENRYQQDSVTNKQQLKLKREELDHEKANLRQCEKEMRKYIWRQRLAYGVAIIVIIFSLVI